MGSFFAEYMRDVVAHKQPHVPIFCTEINGEPKFLGLSRAKQATAESPAGERAIADAQYAPGSCCSPSRSTPQGGENFLPHAKTQPPGEGQNGAND